MTKLSTWIVNWHWKLSAVDMFDVNLGLLPGVSQIYDTYFFKIYLLLTLQIGATIVTYFIFIFQLKMSEREATKRVTT